MRASSRFGDGEGREKRRQSASGFRRALVVKYPARTDTCEPCTELRRYSESYRGSRRIYQVGTEGEDWLGTGLAGSRRKAGRHPRQRQAAPGITRQRRARQKQPSCCRAAVMPRLDWLSGRCWWPLWPSLCHACLSARPSQQRVCESPRCRNGGAHAGSRPGLGASLSRACPPSHPAVLDFPTAPGG